MANICFFFKPKSRHVNLEADFSVTEWFLYYVLWEDFNELLLLHYFILFNLCKNNINMWLKYGTSKLYRPQTLSPSEIQGK